MALKRELAESLYDALLENETVGLWVTDADGRFLEVNDMVVQRCGYARQALLRMRLDELQVQQAAGETAVQLQTTRQAGRGQFHGQYRTQAGGVWLAGVSMRYVDGRFFCFVYDVTNHRHVEDELRRKGEALENSLNGFDIISADGAFLYANRAYLRMWGYDSLDEILGTAPAGHCADPAVAAQIIRNLEEKGEYTLEFTARRKDGSTFEVVMFAQKVVDAQGVVTYVGTSIDITEQKQAREALRASEQRYQLLSEMTSDYAGAFRMGENGRLEPEWITGAVTQITGYTVEELRDMGGLLAIMYPEDQARIRRERPALLAGKRPVFEQEYRIIARDGTLHWLRDHGRAELDPETGRVVRFYTAAQDITARKEAELALRESQAQLAGVISSAMDAIILLDDAQRIVLFNAAAEEMYGHAAADVIGQPHDMLLPARFRAAHRQHVARFSQAGLSNRRMAHRDRLWGLRANGKEFPIEVSISRVQVSGQPLYAAIMRDVTEREEAEKAVYLMSDTQRQIAQLNRVEDIYQLVGQKVQELVGDGYTVVTIRDEHIEAMRILGLYGFGDRYQKLVQRFKIDPARLTYPLADMTAAELRQFRSGKLEQIEGGLYALFTRKVPQSICHLVEKQLRLTAVHTISFAWDDLHYGGLTILATRDIAPYADMIETIMNQASVAIKRIKSEEALRGSEERLRLFIEHAPAALAMFDTDMRYVAVSHRWLADYGLEGEAITGRSHYDVFPEIPDRWKALHRRGLAGEVLRTEEDPFLRLDGQTQWVRWEIRPWHTAADTIGGIVIFSEDITGRKLAETALHESQAILAQAESVAGIGSWKWDLATQKVTWSAEMFRLFGVDPDGFDGDLDRVIQARIHPDDKAAVNASNVEVLKAHNPVPLEYRIVLPDGTQRTVWAEGRLERDAAGQPTALVGYVQDISERKQAEEALRQSEERFAKAFRLSPAALSLTTDDGRILDVNESYERLSGYRRAELIGRDATTLNLFTAEQRAALREQMAAQGGVLREAEIVVRSKTGEPRHVLYSVEVVELESESCALTLAFDITDRKRMETAVRQLNRRLELILNSAGEGIYGTDTDGRITFVNRAMAEMVGWTPAELRGQEAHALLHHTDADGRPYPGADCCIHRAMRDAREYRIDGELYWRRDGSSFEVDCTCNPLRDGEQVVGTVVVVKDITERRRAAAEQALLEEQLRQAQKMESIGRLAGGVAHDFNNQLTIIQIYGELMRGKMAPDDPLRPKLAQILQAGQHAAGLTRQLLAFSRKQLLQPVVLNLNELVENLQKMLARLIGEDIALTAVLQPALWQVLADPGQIEQVIMNLVINARDAMPTGGTLTLETRNVLLDDHFHYPSLEVPNGPCVLLTVSDTGHGMDAATRRQIFEPFFTTKQVGKGTGLGLATVHGIVKQSGGDIYVYSEPGQGSTFKVYLPATGVDVAAGADGETAVAMQRGSETILLVEDDDLLRELVRESLEEIGYRVLEAGSGEAALALAAQPTPPVDLLLTDVVMPQMSGREVAEQIQARQPGIKVLFMSGYMDDAVVRHGLLTAEINFLPKPFTRSALASKVREVLDSG